MQHPIFEFALRAALIAAGTAAVLRLLRVKTAATRHGAWAGVLLLMMLLPMWTPWGPKASLRVLPAVTAPAASPATIPAALSLPAPGAASYLEISPAPGPRVVWNWPACLACIYLLGACALLVAGTVRAQTLVRRAAIRTGRLTSSSCAAPVTVGWLRPGVILPECWRRWPQTQLDAVLTHEREHARRRDPLVQWLAPLNRAIFWFHPLAWWLERRLSAQAEEACDAAVLACGHDPFDYSGYLLEIARSVSRTGARVHILGMAMPGSFLPQRIRRILEARPAPQISRVRMACMAMACAIVSAVFAVGAVDRQKPEQRISAPTVTVQTLPAPVPFDLHPARVTGLPFENEQRALGKDGKYRWFLIRYNPLHDEQGRILRWYATGTDIDDRKQVEERMRKENLALREEIDRSSMYEEIVGSSAALRSVISQVNKVAPTDSTVMIFGETGTGKELIASAIHKRSKRAAKAFIRVNCAAIPPSLIASELFGHEKGAFTGALQRRAGRFESADGGTIFLDEIGELSIETQIALLRVLQEREFERVGSSRPIAIDVRVLAAINRDLEAGMAAGTFRQDLFYRLNVFPLRVPALRERKDDIPLLMEYLVDRYAKRAGKRITHIKKSTLDLFQAYDWPGNVRELQNVIERGVILCEEETFSVDETWVQRKSSQPSGELLSRSSILAEGKSEFADRERKAIEAALTECHGRVSGPSGAAAKLGIPRQTLESKIAGLGIHKSRFKVPPPA